MHALARYSGRKGRLSSSNASEALNFLPGSAILACRIMLDSARSYLRSNAVGGSPVQRRNSSVGARLSSHFGMCHALIHDKPATLRQMVIIDSFPDSRVSRDRGNLTRTMHQASPSTAQLTRNASPSSRAEWRSSSRATARTRSAIAGGVVIAAQARNFSLTPATSSARSPAPLLTGT